MRNFLGSVGALLLVFSPLLLLVYQHRGKPLAAERAATDDKEKA